MHRFVRRAPRLAFALLALCLAPAGPGAVAESLVVEAPLARVVFDDPALEPWARRVAAETDAALREVAALFGADPRPAVVTIDDDSDAYNASATALPRDAAATRALFPVDIAVGRDAADPLRLLLLHEVTHLVQLGWRGLPEDPALALPDLGLVGQGIVAAVPSWFVEGVATWVESETTAGGRRDDAATRGLLRALALEEDAWPSLADASLATHAPWPGGLTRYLLGAAFLDHLVDRYGWGAIPAVLDEVRGGPPWRDFSGAWRAATGADLAAEWDAWHAAVRAAAERAAATEPAPVALTESGGATALPTLSPAGDRLAWRAPDGALRLAALVPAGHDAAPRLEGTRTLAPGLAPTSLAWLDDATLIATALVRRPGSLRAEVLRIDAASGRVETLTRGARAHLARPDPWRSGCLLFVRDRVPGDSELLRLCPAPGRPPAPAGADAVGTAAGWGAVEPLWRPPGGMRIVGFAVHPERGAALALWRGGAARLALLTAPGAAPRWLTGAAGDALEPVFTATGALRFASDASGVWQLIELPSAALGAAGARTARRLTGDVGGADQPSAGSVYRRLGGRGYDLALLPAGGAGIAAALAVVADPGPPPVAPPRPDGAAFPLRRYDPRPSLAPYGWLPSAAALSDGGVALELSVYAQDDAGRLGSRLAAGYDGALAGPFGGAWLYLDVTGDPDLSPRPAPLLAWSARVGAWPHAPHRAARSETAFGGRLGARLRLAFEGVTLGADARVGLLHLASTGALGIEAAGGVGVANRTVDRWGVPLRGGALRLRAALSPTPAGSSAGLWLDAEGALPLPPLGPLATGGVASLRAGWRMPPPLPLALADWAAVAAVGTRHTASTRLRWGDGLLALERVAFEPTARLWLGAGDAGGLDLGVGADLGLAADLVVGYGAPLRVALRGGWANGPWWRWEFSTPF